MFSIGTRGSHLATTQSGHVRDALEEVGHPAELQIVTTSGDLSQAPVERIGVGVFTAGFFAAHTVASGWVGAVAQRDRAEASALYLFSYYLGSSVAGAAGGLAYQAGGWALTVLFVSALLAIALVLAAVMMLRNRFGHINAPE